MRKRRYLAPWHRKGLDVSGLGADGEEGVAALAGLAALEGRPAIYHCVSRVVNRGFVLLDAEKDEFVRLMRCHAAFSRVTVLDYCVMTNHFHLVLEVPARPEDGGASWSDGELLEHLATIYRGAELAGLRRELKHHREQGNEAAAEAFRARFLRRMWDLSEYMKSLKQCFTQWLNRRQKRRGVLWEGRFTSELVEDGHAVRRVAGYVDLNPVRAGIVRDPKDYRWSGYGEAVAGGRAAREGLRRVMLGEHAARMDPARAARELAGWSEVARKYRLELFAAGEQGPRDEAGKRAGISKGEVARVLAEGGRLSEAELIRCRTRYFADGLVIGSARFVNLVFALTREHFGPRRRSGARPLRQVATTLCTMRDLRREAVVA